MKWIWNSSLARSIMGGFLAFMVTILGLSLWMNSKSIETARTEITNSYQNSMLVLERQLSDRVNMLVNVADYMFTDTNILYLNYKDMNEADQLLAYKTLLENLKFYSNDGLLNADIKIFLKNKGKSFSSVSGYDNISEEDKKNVLNIDVKYTGRWRLQDGNLIFIRNPSFSRESKGIVAMASIGKVDVLKFLNNLNVTDPGGSLFLADMDGNRLFSSESTDVDQSQLFEKTSEMKDDAGQFLFNYGRTTYRVIYEKSPSTGLMLGMYFSENYAMRKISGTGTLMVLFSLTAVLLALLFTWVVYSKFLKPFHVLAEGMDKVGKGNFKTRIDFIPKKDFGFVFNQFNKMVNDTEKLINEVYLAQLNQKNTQLKLLQSRINPHFLYNCLNFIYQMSMGEDNEGAAKMASYLGKYFRFIAKCNFDTITLLEECDNVETLLKIQSMRFRGRISYKINLEEDMKNISVPSLIIQPIVENAIVHGLKHIQGSVFILIRTIMEEDRMLIVVEDDGNGISEEDLAEIRRKLDVFNVDGVGQGLNNTHWRLKLKYGEKSGVRIENLDSGGVRVTLCLGNKKGEEQNV